MKKQDSATKVELSERSINLLAERLAVLLTTSNSMSFKEARVGLFHGKGTRWIKYYILDRYDDIFDDAGGWITRPRGKGCRIVVTDVIKAREWLLDHRIDWSAPDPLTIENNL